MKKLILALIVLLSVGTAVAQTKIAHVNSNRLLDSLPSRQAALKQLQEFSINGEKELQEMEADLNKKIQKFQTDQPTMTPITIKYEQEKLQRLSMAIEQRQEELQQQISQMNNELNAPILKRMQKAVDIVSERKKLNYVIDETAAVYFKGGTDITDEVLVELLKLDKAETGK